MQAQVDSNGSQRKEPMMMTCIENLGHQNLNLNFTKQPVSTKKNYSKNISYDRESAWGLHIGSSDLNQTLCTWITIHLTQHLNL